MSAGYFCPTTRWGLDCSERSERRLVTIPALATHTTVPTVALTFRPCPKRSRDVCLYVRVLCVFARVRARVRVSVRVRACVRMWWLCVCVCVPPVCGPGPGLRPPVRGTAPRFPNRARARFP